MNESEQKRLARSCADIRSWPIMICLLGNFRLLQAGEPVPIRTGGKAEALLAHVALLAGRRLPPDRLAEALWPHAEPDLALHSLTNLVSSVNKLLGPALQNAAAVLHEEGYYRLNVEAGIGVDVACFDSLAHAGDQQMRAGDSAAALASYSQAAELYRDELCLAADDQIMIERERLRARYLTLLARIADSYYSSGDFLACLTYAWRLLGRDPYREDVHRLVMRCYVRHGERAAALHQFEVCSTLLRAKFNTEPEPATTALFEQIRDQPDTLEENLASC